MGAHCECNQDIEMQIAKLIGSKSFCGADSAQ